MCSKGSFEADIIGFFLKARTYVCLTCETKMETSMDDADLYCPACGALMVEEENLAKIYICPNCKYMSWVEPGGQEVCDTCGASLEGCSARRVRPSCASAPP